jgi:TolB protein
MVLGLCLLALTAAATAGAAFPGTNGPIAFNSNRDVAAGEIYAITPGGTAARLTSSSTSSNPAVSPDGSRIAYISADPGGSYQVFVVNADGSGRTPVTTGPTAKQEPTWSPDGTRIAYVANSLDVDGQTDLEIWAINADGSGRTQLTQNTSPDSEPAWSPSGERIAFTGTRAGDTNNNVYVMDAEGTNETNLTPNESGDCSPCYQGHDESPAWSPDGAKIGYVHGHEVAGGGLPDIWTMNPDGGDKVNLSNNDSVSFTQPAWSPEGDRLAAVGVAASTTNRNIWVMGSDGAGQTPIDTSPANDINPDWGPPAPPRPPDPPLPDPPAFDATAPDLDLSGKKVQTLGGLVEVKIGCDESCEARATGKVIVRTGVGSKGPVRFSAKGLSVRLKAASVSLAAGQRRTVKLKLSKQKLRKVGRAAKAPGAKVKAMVEVGAIDGAGNESTAQRTVRLKLPTPEAK